MDLNASNGYAKFSGNVGIGRDATYNLDVNGSIRGSDRLYWNGTNQLVYLLNYQNLSYDAEVVTDTTANQGTAAKKPSAGYGGSTFFYGNYTSFPPGNYVAYFRMKVTSNSSGSSLGQLDVVGADIVPFAINLRPNMFQANNTWQYIRLPFTITGGGYIEWRMVGFQTGITDLFLDHVMIYQEGIDNNLFVRNGYSIYVNQGALAFQINTSGSINTYGSYLSIDGAGVSSPPAGLGYGLFPHSSVGLGISSVVDISFWTGSTPSQKMRLTGDGELWINTNSSILSGAKLQVQGTGAFGQLYAGSLGTGALYSNAGYLTNTNPSDLRLKNTINPLTYGLNEILQLNPKTFYYNDDVTKSRLKYGFVAQDVKEVMPELARKLDETSDYLGLETEGIFVTLVNAVKEQQSQINEQKTQINELKSQLNK